MINQTKFRYFNDPNDQTIIEVPSEDIETWYNGFGAVVEGEGEVNDERCYFLPVDPEKGQYCNIIMWGKQYAEDGVLTLTHDGEAADITGGDDFLIVYTYSDGANFYFIQLDGLEEEDLSGLEVLREGEWDKGVKTDIFRCGDRVFERTEYQCALPTELTEIDLPPTRR